MLHIDTCTHCRPRVPDYMSPWVYACKVDSLIQTTIVVLYYTILYMCCYIFWTFDRMYSAGKVMRSMRTVSACTGRIISVHVTDNTSTILIGRLGLYPYCGI